MKKTLEERVKELTEALKESEEFRKAQGIPNKTYKEKEDEPYYVCDSCGRDSRTDSFLSEGEPPYCLSCGDPAELLHHDQ